MRAAPGHGNEKRDVGRQGRRQQLGLLRKDTKGAAAEMAAIDRERGARIGRRKPGARQRADDEPVDHALMACSARKAEASDEALKRNEQRDRDGDEPARPGISDTSAPEPHGRGLYCPNAACPAAKAIGEIGV